MMAIENKTDSEVAETKAALDRAARDLSAAETKLGQRFAELKQAEAAVAAAAERGEKEEVAKACERRLVVKEEIRSARQAFSHATEVHSDASCEHERACIRKEGTALVEKWSGLAENLAADYESGARTIVGAMASDRFIVEAAERASRHRDTPRLRTRGWLISANLLERLCLPRLFPLSDGSRPHFWHPSRQLDDLKDAPLSELVPVASLGLGDPITSPEQWERLNGRIKTAEAHLFDLYTRTASGLAARLNNEWSIRGEIDAAKHRFSGAGMGFPILPDVWPATAYVNGPAVEARLPKLGSRDYHTLAPVAS
jgi:hypothetical protein